MRKSMVYGLFLFVLVSPALTSASSQLYWNVAVDTVISYEWKYEGNPYPESRHDYNFTYEDTFDIIILQTEQLDSYNSYDRTKSISYRIESTDTLLVCESISYLHPLPLGNWSYIQLVFSSVYPNITYTDNTQHMIMNFTIGLPYSNFPKAIEYQYSKTDGIVDNVVEKWYNTTSGEQIFCSEITRIHVNDSGNEIITIVFASSIVIIFALAVVFRKNRG